jgi:perosamine synthetase
MRPRVDSMTLPGSGIKSPLRIGPPRLLTQLGGTTTLADCLVAIRYLLNPRHLVQGPLIAEYERAFARRIGVRYAYSFASGRIGLYEILRAFGVGPGDEVLLQAPTHVVVPNAIRFAGAQPVYVDCGLHTYNMDLEQVEQKITPRTKVLLLQHTFGVPADMDRAKELADKHGLAVVEDCVHALGATYDGRPVGSLGRAAFFSTEETKTITSTMGGMVVTDDPELGARLQELQAGCAWPTAKLTARYILKFLVYHLFTHPYLFHWARSFNVLLRQSPKTHLAPEATSLGEQIGVRPPDYEQRLSQAQAALALRQLERLDDNVAHRRAVANAYRAGLAPSFDGPRVPGKAQPAFVRFPIRVADRELAMRVAARRAALGEWFPSVVYEAVSPRHGDYVPGSCPNAETLTGQLVNLPTHMRVRGQDVEAIVAALTDAASALTVKVQAQASPGLRGPS